MDRREILKMFGITVAAGATGVAVAKVAAAEVPLNIPALPELKPPGGMVYQWKRIFITAEEPDLGNIANMVASGWKPVPQTRHPELPVTATAYWIEVGGLVLMEKSAKDIPPPVAYPVPVEADGTDEWVENDSLWED
jgi:hypothetical protein